MLMRSVPTLRPFSEGNEEIALIASLTFLALNGRADVSAPEEWVSWVLTPAEDLPVERLADRIRLSVHSPWE